MKAERITIRNRGIQIAMIAAITVGILFAIRMAIILEISRDVYVMANSVLSIAMLMLELTLMLGVTFNSYQDAKFTRIFTLMTLIAFLSTFCGLFFYEAWGLTEYSEAIRVMYLLNYGIASTYYGAFRLYIRALDRRKDKSRVLDFVIWIDVLIYAAIMISDIFLKKICTVEAGVPAFEGVANRIGGLLWITIFLTTLICIIRADLTRKEKWSLMICVIIPVSIAAITMFASESSWLSRLNSIEDFALILFLYLTFFNVYQERGRMLLVKEKELMQSKLNTTILQANPHFIYNTLGSIEYFCDRDPATAKKMLDDFTKYLRSNSANLANRPLIPFLEELENLKAYLRIEMIRFPNLRVEIDIPVDNFSVPCLSVQPLVENAIKHGIGKRRGKAGTVTVRTTEAADFWRIEIIDDGVGYAGIPLDGRAHIGIENVRGRLAILCGGTLAITGTEGRGTVAEIRIPKKRKETVYDSTLR